VFVALCIHHAKRMRRIAICGLSVSTIILRILSHKRYDISEKVTEHKLCVLILSTSFTRNISHSNKNSARYCHKCPWVITLSGRYSCQISMKLEFSRQIFRKTLVAFGNFTNAPKNSKVMSMLASMWYNIKSTFHEGQI
jgi:hypothetical protein